MKIKRQFTIRASAEKLWEIMGIRFADVSDWASSIDSSQATSMGIVPIDAPCGGRICQTSMGSFREKILTYDPHQRIISYDAKGDKMPFFVRSLVNSWVFTPLSDSRCQVDMSMEISLLPVIGLLMAPLMRMQMGGMIDQVVEELTYFSETGIPHPRKRDAQLKPQTRAIAEG